MNRYFDSTTLQRARSYVSKGYVEDIEKRPNGILLGQVSNGRGMAYRQTIHIDDRRIEGYCSCPVGFNCKHVAAVLLQETARPDLAQPTLSYDAQVWLHQTQHLKITADTPATARPEDYPPRVTDPLGRRLPIRSIAARRTIPFEPQQKAASHPSRPLMIFSKNNR